MGSGLGCGWGEGTARIPFFFIVVITMTVGAMALESRPKKALPCYAIAATCVACLVLAFKITEQFRHGFKLDNSNTLAKLPRPRPLSVH